MPAAQESGGLATSPQAIAGFGTDVPASVKTVRVTYKSGSLNCCVAVDPRDTTVINQGVVLTNLRPETADVALAGFPTDFAPADGATATCQTNPSSVARTCDGTRFATASFASETRRVTVVGGSRTNVSDLNVFPKPFLIDSTLSPAPAGFASSPLSARFTVADAGVGVDGTSLSTLAVQGGTFGTEILNTVPCSDITGPFCSSGGSLRVSGLQVTTTAIPYAIGNAGLRVRAANLSGGSMDSTYNFTIAGIHTPTRTAAVPATPTPTRTRTRTLTPTRTPTGLRPTPTITPTFLPTSTPPPTRSKTPTRTATRTATFTATRTATATPTATPTETPTITPTVTATYTVTFTYTPSNLECEGTPVPIPVAADLISLSDTGEDHERRVKIRISDSSKISVSGVSNPSLCGAVLSVAGGRAGDGTATVSLPPALWDNVGFPPGVRGFRYTDRSTRFGISSVRVRPTKYGGAGIYIRGGGRAWPYAITRPQGTPLKIRFQIGNQIYCSEFRDLALNKDGRVIGRKGTAPATCSLTP